MAEEKRDCNMLCEPIGPCSDKEEFEKGIRDAFAASRPVFFYRESVKECILEKIPAKDIKLPDDAFEGHVFDENTDIRWAKCSDGKWRGWKTTEADGNDSVSVNAFEPRRYYLLGEYNEEETGKVNRTGVIAFTEGRYPGKRFEYPVAGAKEHDRAFITVVEYRRAKPDWDNVENIAEALDAPLFCGHRFVKVDVGRGE